MNESPRAERCLCVSVTTDLSPLAVVDLGPAARHAAHQPVLQLQLQLPIMHRQDDPGTVQVTPGEEDDPFRIEGAEVKLG